jgi:serine/threonine-protein kinase
VAAAKPLVGDFPIVPGYEIAGILGHGGMGVVYKARQKSLNRWVALKMVLAQVHVDPRQLARFQAEAEAVASLQHPNIVQIYEIGEQDRLPFFSLELVGGGSLAQRIRGNPQQPREAAYVVETLARAVAYAHERGIVHRDLKPANVLLTEEGVPKITDFGLAKRLEGDSGQTKSGMLLGTPSYMAPEQARGDVHAVGPLSDVYALGAILYEMISGRPPFQGSSSMDTVTQVATTEPTPPSRLRPNVARDLETICLKCLQKEPSRRYADANALAEDLKRFLAGEPIRARPIAAPERLWRWCRRNPWVAALSAAVFLLLVTGTAVSTTSWLRIRREQAATIEQFERAEANARLEIAARQEADDRKRAAERAEIAARENAKIAGEQRAIALSTLYKLVTQVQEKLRFKEDMGGLRKDLLQTAMDGLDQVSKSAGKSNLADRSMGVALQHLGQIYEQMGQTEKAMEQYRLSLTIFDRLAKEEPENDWIPWNQAVSFDHLGGVTRDYAGDAIRALTYYQQALALRQALAALVRTPAPTPVQRGAAISVSFIKLANMALDLGDPAAAKGYARQALEQNEAILATRPQDALALRFLSMSAYLLGQAESHLERPGAGREQLRRSIEMREKAVRADPTDAAAKKELAAALEALGDLELKQRDARSALAAYEKAQALCAAVVAKEPNNAESQWYLAFTHYHLGQARQMLGDRERAVREFGVCRTLRQALVKNDPGSVQMQTELMLAQAHCGEHREASLAAAGIRKRSAKNAALLFAVARTYALCAAAVGAGSSALSTADQALQKRYSDEGLATLEQAIGLGYRDRVALERDPDLEGLRGSPAYPALLERLAARS